MKLRLTHLSCLIVLLLSLSLLLSACGGGSKNVDSQITMPELSPPRPNNVQDDTFYFDQDDTFTSQGQSPSPNQSNNGPVGKNGSQGATNNNKTGGTNGNPPKTEDGGLEAPQAQTKPQQKNNPQPAPDKAVEKFEEFCQNDPGACE